MDNVPRNNTETAKLQHSGDLGLEQPVTHYDNTSLPEAFDKHLTDTDGNVIVPETITGVAPETEAPKKKRNKLLITLGSVGAGLALVGGAVFGVKAITDQGENNVPTPDDKATNQPSEAPSPDDEGEGGETTGNYANPDIERVINNPDRVSPQEIAAMSPQELTDFATISYEEAPSPEEYAQKFVTVYDAWMNSGLTEEELSPYENAAKNVYEQAMADKYDDVYISSLFGISDLDGFRAVHQSTLNNYRVGHGLTDIDYSLGNIYKGVEVISDSGTENGFKIIVNMEVASNEEEAGVTQIAPGEKDVYKDLSIQLTVGSIDGNYKIMSAETVNE